MEEQHWLDAIQETLFVVLCLSRLLISYERMMFEKSGLILVFTLINAADLLSISHSLQYHDVIIERVWMYVGLILLTIGLFDMAFVDSDALISYPYEDTSNSRSRRLPRRINFFKDQTVFPLFRVSLIKENYFNIVMLFFSFSPYLFMMVFFSFIDYC